MSNKILSADTTNPIPLNVRKQEYKIMTILTLFSLLILSSQNLYAVLYRTQDSFEIFTAETVITVIIFMINSCYAANVKQILKLYFLMDTLLVAEIVTFLSYYMFFNLLRGFNLQLKLLYSFFILRLFFCIGNFRVCIKYTIWQRWRIIVCKIILIAANTISFYVGAQVLTSTKSFKQPLLMYIFALFTVQFEMFSKLSDFDQTNEFQTNYIFKDHFEEQEKLLLHNWQGEKNASNENTLSNLKPHDNSNLVKENIQNIQYANQ